LIIVVIIVVLLHEGIILFILFLTLTSFVL